MSRVRLRPQVNVAWCGPALLIADALGAVGSEPLTGFYFRETRYLSRLVLSIAGQAPHLCSIQSPSPRELCIVAIFPELVRFSGGGTGESGQEPTPVINGLPARSLELRLRFLLRPASLMVSTTLVNRASEPIEFLLSWSLAADFADLLEVMDAIAPPAARTEWIEGEVRLLDPRLPIETRVRATPADWQWTAAGLSTRLTLASKQEQQLELQVRAVDHEQPISMTDEDERLQHCSRWRDSLTRIFVAADAPIAGGTTSSIEDVGSLALLEGAPTEWLAPAAGVPLYPALFARDALTASWQSLLFDCGAMLDAALTVCGRLQGQEQRPERDEQPGRIIQQARRGPLARLGLNPFACYYGDFASPFDFVMYLGQLFAWTGDRSQLGRHWDAARRVMDWARDYADLDGDGFLEYCTQSPAGPLHQGWKDSGRAIVDEHGAEVKPPLAVAEVQGYYFAAQQTMAVLSLIQHDRESAVDWWKSARRLKQAFNRAFWLEDEGFPALALDAGKAPVRTIASNAGQCLATGVVADENVARLVRRLFQSDLFSGWGIRTLSSKHPAYNPLSYHLGSVWPVENGTIVFGLRRYGFEDRALELSTALYDLSNLFVGYRTPECVGGFAREELPNPGAYPQANAPQAWNQSVPGILLQSILGIFPIAVANTLLLDPLLPPWLPQLELRDLRVGRAKVTIRFERNKTGSTGYDVLAQEGQLRLIRQPPLDALDVGWLDRIGAFLKSVW